MLIFILKTLATCTFLLSWGLLSLASISLIWRYKNKKEMTLLLIPLVGICWGLASYSTWYENFFLVQKMSLLPTLYSWAMTVTIPLFYLYCHFRATGLLPEKSQWWLHLSPSILLASFYIVMSMTNQESDSLTYNWSEYLSSFPAWWTIFRLSCILSGSIQIAIYLWKLRKTNEINETFPQLAISIRKKKIFLTYSILIFLLNILASSYISNILFSLYIALLSGYIFYHSLLHQLIKWKFVSRIHIDIDSEVNKTNEKENLFIEDNPADEKEMEEYDAPKKTEAKAEIQLAPAIIEQINQRLMSPEFLFNEKITLKQLSQTLGINSTYLSRYFKQEHGCSFPKFISLQRLEKAENLLKKPGTSVEDICFQTGFESPSTFYKVFRDRHGCSPIEWKKKYLKQNND